MTFIVRIVTVVGFFLAGFTLPSAAAFRLCAYRNGPSGPCTCEAGTPGAFVQAPSRFCRKNAPKATAKNKAGDPAQAAAAAPTPGPAAQPAADPQRGEPAAETPAPPAPAISTSALSGGARLDAIRQRGKLACGVNAGLLGFSIQTASGDWTGMDVDFCRALAAALYGDPAKVDFIPLETNERFEALKSGKIDILSRNTTWTMSREVDLGLDFPGVLYFDGQGFMTSDERGLVSAQQLAGAKVCVEKDTTSEANMAFYFKAHAIEVETQSFETRGELVKAYLSGACDAYSGDRSSLFADRAQFAEPQKHAVLPEVISKEPLSPAVLSGDHAWSSIVRWTLAGLVNAEEAGFTRAIAAGTGGAKPDGIMVRLLEGAGRNGEKLGLKATWLKDAVAATGNFGEMYEANLGKQSALGMERGINALWKKGGLLFAPPMW